MHGHYFVTDQSHELVEGAFVLKRLTITAHYLSLEIQGLHYDQQGRYPPGIFQGIRPWIEAVHPDTGRWQEADSTVIHNRTVVLLKDSFGILLSGFL